MIALAVAVNTSPLVCAADETIVVTGSDLSDYFAESDPARLSSGSASRLGLTDKQTPRHTETISARTITAKSKRTLTEVVETAPGMSGTSSPTLSNSVSLRGFSGVSWLLNGVAVPGSTIQIADPVHYENVDILYGTGSVLNGLSSAGGSVNLISRKATFGRQPVEADYSWSSYNSHRAHIGAGGTLVEGIAAGRVDVSTSNTGTQVDKDRSRPKRISAQLLLTPTDNTQVTFDIDRSLTDMRNPYFGTPVINGKVDRDLRHVNYNNIQDAHIRSQATSFQSTQSWYATPDLTFDNQFYYYKGFREWQNVERYYQSNKAVYVTRDSYGDLAHDDKLTGNRTMVTWDHPVASFANRVTAGVDFSKREFQYYSNGFPGGEEVLLTNPASSDFRTGASGKMRSPVRHITQNQYALLLEDNLNITDAVALLSQLRYTRLDMRWNYQQDNKTINRGYSFMSVGIGPSWAINENWTVYANYSTGKEPGGDIFFISPEQTTLPLTEVQQYETGVKGTFDHGEMKLAVYDLQKKNLYQQSAVQAGVWNAVGKQTSRGIEFSGLIKPLDSVVLAGNVAYTHARFDHFKQGTQDLSGNQPRYIPEWTANLSGRYMPISKLGLGAQLHYVGSSYNDDANKNKMGDYTTVDLNADYEVIKDVTVGTRVRNLTDRFYTWQRTYTGQEMIAPGRTYEAYVNMRF
ncbi:TonB-dependent receptor [Salmonella enterica]|uniref:TonB-dependent receptor n=1 Tax=Salmonella enterica TaxID=28901 RepID=UPI003D31E170